MVRSKRTFLLLRPVFRFNFLPRMISNAESEICVEIVNIGGTLCVSFMTNEDSTLAAPSTGYTTNTAAKFITSGDSGLTWGNKITVGQVLSVWPGLYALGAASLLMLFDNGGAKAQTITLS